MRDVAKRRRFKVARDLAGKENSLASFFSSRLSMLNRRSSQTCFALSCSVPNGELIHRRLFICVIDMRVPLTLNLRRIGAGKDYFECVYGLCSFHGARAPPPCAWRKTDFSTFTARDDARCTRRFQVRPSPPKLHSFIAPFSDRRKRYHFPRNSAWLVSSSYPASKSP